MKSTYKLLRICDLQIKGFKEKYELSLEKRDKWDDFLSIEPAGVYGKERFSVKVPFSNISEIKFKKPLFRDKCVLSIYMKNGDTSLLDMKFPKWGWVIRDFKKIKRQIAAYQKNH